MYLLQNTITDLVVVAKHCNTILDPANANTLANPHINITNCYILFWITTANILKMK